MSAEERIAELESAIHESELKLSTYLNADESVRVATVLEQQRRSLEAAMSEWEEVSQQIEATA